MQGSTLKNCIIGCNSYIGQGCKITETIVLGNDNYTNDTSRTASRKKGEAVLGVGRPPSAQLSVSNVTHMNCKLYLGLIGYQTAFICDMQRHEREVLRANSLV